MRAVRPAVPAPAVVPAADRAADPSGEART
jgi:hypothetical protein